MTRWSLSISRVSRPSERATAGSIQLQFFAPLSNFTFTTLLLRLLFFFLLLLRYSCVCQGWSDIVDGERSIMPSSIITSSRAILFCEPSGNCFPISVPSQGLELASRGRIFVTHLSERGRFSLVRKASRTRLTHQALLLNFQSNSPLGLLDKSN